MNQEYQYLVARLEEALAVDARVNVLDIRITVANGRVHLCGQVTTRERRAAVQRITEEVLPGLAVRNDITVIELAEPGEPESLE
ncbi:MAG TPA: BON domain-containing protein [Candidatus Binatia bacterium]